jgi:hypothetical protein
MHQNAPFYTIENDDFKQLFDKSSGGCLYRRLIPLGGSCWALCWREPDVHSKVKKLLTATWDDGNSRSRRRA